MTKGKKSLGLLFPAMRIGIALALLTACILLSADMLGFTLDEDAQALQNRKQIAESLAIQFSVMEPKKDIDKTIADYKHAAQCAKRAGFDGVELHEVGHVVDEAERLASVQEPDGGRVARREHRRLGHDRHGGHSRRAARRGSRDGRGRPSG